LATALKNMPVGLQPLISAVEADAATPEATAAAIKTNVAITHSTVAGVQTTVAATA
jgi:hypothetical protein